MKYCKIDKVLYWYSLFWLFIILQHTTLDPPYSSVQRILCFRENQKKKEENYQELMNKCFFFFNIFYFFLHFILIIVTYLNFTCYLFSIFVARVVVVLGLTLLSWHVQYGYYFHFYRDASEFSPLILDFIYFGSFHYYVVYSVLHCDFRTHLKSSCFF